MHWFIQYDKWVYKCVWTSPWPKRSQPPYFNENWTLAQVESFDKIWKFWESMCFANSFKRFQRFKLRDYYAAGPTCTAFLRRFWIVSTVLHWEGKGIVIWLVVFIRSLYNLWHSVQDIPTASNALCTSLKLSLRSFAALSTPQAPQCIVVVGFQNIKLAVLKTCKIEYTELYNTCSLHKMPSQSWLCNLLSSSLSNRTDYKS